MRGLSSRGCRKVLSSFWGRLDVTSRLRIPNVQRSIHHARGVSTLRIFIVAGEPSGDVIGSRLMASLRSLSPQPLEFSGVGGPLMENVGLQSQFPMDDITVMGLVELIPHSFRLWRRMRETIRAAVEFEPNIVITVDSKGFSFRLLRGIAEEYAYKGKPRPLSVHYVAPSFWAWKGGEKGLKSLSSIVDHLLCILPFEEDVCRANGLGATFVGHPFWKMLRDEERSNLSQVNRTTFREQHQISSGSTLLSVLPGSRLQEVRRMLPIFRDSVALLWKSFPDLTVAVPTVQSGPVTNYVESFVRDWSVPTIVLPGVSDMDKYRLFSSSNAALCTSGTAVLQVYLAQVPCLAAYRAHFITEYFIRQRTRLKYISLPNIILNANVVPEALFASCTAVHIASTLRTLIEEKELQRRQVSTVDTIRTLLSPKNFRLSTLERNSSLSPEDVKCSSKPSVVAASCVLKLAGFD